MKLSAILKTLCVGAVMTCTVAFADSVKVTANSPYYSSPNGGELNAVTTDFGSFLTFCLERLTEISPGVWYPYTVGPAAIKGGVGNSTPGEVGFDTISQGTAWLYLGFLDGTLGSASGVGSSYGADRITNAGLLQQAIWGLEDEIAAPVGNLYYTWALGHGGKTNYTGHEVAVINPTIREQDRQSLLVRVPDGGATAILLGTALIGLAVIRRRK